MSATSDGELQAACAASLSSLPGMGPAALTRLLDTHGPVEGWEEVKAGRVTREPVRDRGRALPGLAAPAHRAASARRPWSEHAMVIDPVEWWRRIRPPGVGVTWRGQPDFPEALLSDPAPPGVLFWRGRLDTLDAPCVAVVGTRSATPDGCRVAFEMGRDLAAAGVCVVSGLALGIDGAVHAGVLEALRLSDGAGPAGVAASGVDVPYPRRHASLWERVAESGVLLSENLPGRPAQAWRFPSRNRVIAGLVRMVVVVESHAGGGSLITADAAIDRGIDVRAVPGPVRSPASAGTNQLLCDGPGPVRGAADVLDGLGLFATTVAPSPSGAGRPCESGRPRDPGLRETLVLEALGWTPATLGQVMDRTGLDAASATRLLERLDVEGLVDREGGWWSRAG